MAPATLVSSETHSVPTQYRSDSMFVTSKTHPLPTRHMPTCLETFHFKYKSWDPSKELARGRQEAAKFNAVQNTEDYFDRFNKLMACTVSFAYLFDSLVEFTKNGTGAANTVRRMNTDAMIYQVCRGYIQIDQGWRFFKHDDWDRNVSKAIDPGLIKQPRENGYTGFSLDDFECRNRIYSLASCLGVPVRLKNKFRELHGMLLAINDLMRDGYYEEIKKICTKCGVKREDMMNECADRLWGLGQAKALYNIGLGCTLPSSCGGERYDLIAENASDEFLGHGKCNRFKKQYKKTDTLEQQAKSNQQKMMEAVAAQQQEALHTKKSSKKKKSRRLKRNGRTVTKEVRTGGSVDLWNTDESEEEKEGGETDTDSSQLLPSLVTRKKERTNATAMVRVRSEEEKEGGETHSSADESDSSQLLSSLATQKKATRKKANVIEGTNATAMVSQSQVSGSEYGINGEVSCSDNSISGEVNEIESDDNDTLQASLADKGSDKNKKNLSQEKELQQHENFSAPDEGGVHCDNGVCEGSSSYCELEKESGINNTTDDDEHSFTTARDEEGEVDTANIDKVHVDYKSNDGKEEAPAGQQHQKEAPILASLMNEEETENLAATQEPAASSVSDAQKEKAQRAAADQCQKETEAEKQFQESATKKRGVCIDRIVHDADNLFQKTRSPRQRDHEKPSLAHIGNDVWQQQKGELSTEKNKKKQQQQQEASGNKQMGQVMSVDKANAAQHSTVNITITEVATLGMCVELKKTINTIIVSTVSPDSIAENHGICTEDKIVSVDYNRNYIAQNPDQDLHSKFLAAAGDPLGDPLKFEIERMITIEPFVGLLGIHVTKLTKNNAIFVSTVKPNSVAEIHGISPQDKIVSMEYNGIWYHDDLYDNFLEVARDVTTDTTSDSQPDSHTPLRFVIQRIITITSSPLSPSPVISQTSGNKQPQEEEVSEEPKLEKKLFQYHYASSSSELAGLLHARLDTMMPSNVDGVLEKLGAGQGYDDQGNDDIRSANSCTLISCLANMQRICTGRFHPESMKIIIHKYVTQFWPALTKLDHVFDLQIGSGSGYVDIVDIFEIFWPAYSQFRNRAADGGNILSEKTYQKLSKILSEDDSLLLFLLNHFIIAMKCTTEADGARTTNYVIYEPLPCSFKPFGNESEKEGFIFIGKSAEACMQALKYYVLSKLKHRQTVSVAHNIEDMFIEHIPSYINLDGRDTFNEYIMQCSSFKECQWVLKMTEDEFYKGLDAIIARLKIAEMVEVDKSACMYMDDFTKTLTMTLIKSNSPFPDALKNSAEQYDATERENNVLSNLLNGSESSQEEAEEESSEVESPENKTEYFMQSDDPTNTPSPPKSRTESVKAVTHVEGATSNNAISPNRTTAAQEKVVTNVERATPVHSNVKSPARQFGASKQNGVRSSGASKQSTSKIEPREGKQSPRGKVQISIGVSPTKHLSFEASIEEMDGPKFGLGSMVDIGERPGIGPTLPSGVGRIVSVSTSFPYKYDVVFGNRDTDNGIEEEHLSIPATKRSRKGPSPRQLTDGQGGVNKSSRRKRRKISLGGKIGPEKAEKRDSIKLAHDRRSVATETTGKGKSKSADLPGLLEEKQIVYAKKIAIWRKTFGEIPAGKQPSRSKSRWTDKKCCGHDCQIGIGDWYYGVQGTNDSWELFLCTACFELTIRDILDKEKDIQNDLDYNPICHGSVVSFKRGDESKLHTMNLQQFNNLEVK